MGWRLSPLADWVANPALLINDLEIEMKKLIVMALIAFLAACAGTGNSDPPPGTTPDQIQF